MGQERYRLSPRELEKEAEHIEELPQGRGIVWNAVRRGEEVFTQIFYGFWVSGKMDLLSIDTREPLIPRQPRPEEMLQFMQLIKYAMPGSIYADLLGPDIINRLSTRQSEIGKMIREVSG